MKQPEPILDNLLCTIGRPIKQGVVQTSSNSVHSNTRTSIAPDAEIFLNLVDLSKEAGPADPFPSFTSYVPGAGVSEPVHNTHNHNISSLAIDERKESDLWSSNYPY